MTAILQKWDHTAGAGETTIVLPDGCRDLIFVQRPDAAPEWRYSDIHNAPEKVSLSAGTRLTGFRLRPGARLAPGMLGDLPDPATLCVEDLNTAVDTQTPEAEAISVLSNAPSVAFAARSSGVSERSLRRMLVGATGETPLFWLRLARARRAALRVTNPLCEVAADCGFSDQAHMTREFRKWFGVTPRALREDATLCAQLRQPALATGEQISTK